jgi:bifunctional DNA-binding transcriptional regulator/antitoxin component of YhaV-PrlF toxin-antitoxin module
MAKLVRARRKGQVTIPDEFRNELGIEENSLRVSVAVGELRIKPVEVRDATKGAPWLRELYEYFAPVRQEILEKGYTEEEVNDAIDEAVRAVRAEQRG